LFLLLDYTRFRGRSAQLVSLHLWLRSGEFHPLFRLCSTRPRRLSNFNAFASGTGRKLTLRPPTSVWGFHPASQTSTG